MILRRLKKKYMNNALIFVVGVKLNIIFNDTLQMYWTWTKETYTKH